MYLSNLIPLLNIPVVGIIFRRLLWIDDYKHKVVKLLPYSCHVQINEFEFRAIVYTNNQYDEAARKNLGWLLSIFHFLDIVFINNLKPSLNLGFDDYSSQPDESSGNDTLGYEPTPTTNYGTFATLLIGEDNTATNTKSATFIKFDFTSIPSGSDVSAATMTFVLATNRISTDRSFDFWRSLRAWVELEATYNVWSTGNSWTSSNGQGSGNDHDGNSIGALTFNSSWSPGQAIVWELNGNSYGYIKDIVGNSPVFTNNGFISWEGTLNDGIALHSSSGVTPSNRPKMEITFILSIKQRMFYIQ